MGRAAIQAWKGQVLRTLPESSRRTIITSVVILSVAGILLVIGWRLLWFLTDDAYISFRYVNNSMLGHGYVWNAPPFRPVEGYTNFLWILVLDIVWRAFGVSPPQSANYLSLVFSFLTLLVISSMALRMRWHDRLRGRRLILLGLVLIGITTNRTFLAWSSSGLETAMFNFFLVLWLNSCIFTPPTGRWYDLSLTMTAAAVYLTRPDGLVFLAATVIILYLTPKQHKRHLNPRRMLQVLPLLIVPGHLVWRRLTYGEWLPNSFYAKYTSPWPESGLRYAVSFVLEYGLWVWLGLLVYVIFRWLIRSRAGAGQLTGPRTDRPRIWITAGAFAVHGLYYTLVIGGDHFEYRIYSHLIPLGFISFIWLLNRARLRSRLAIALLLAFIILSWPIPWTHWALSKDLSTRDETHGLFIPVADHWPRALSRWAEPFDKQQAWLIRHYVCVRHQEHKINCETLKAALPSRDEGLRLPAEDFPVLAFPAVGVVSWVMPQVNVIDLHGINDYVIARSPVEAGRTRMMAHDRLAPEGYVSCFRPNVEILPGGKVIVRKRGRALTAEDIVSCETRWGRALRGGGLGP